MSHYAVAHAQLILMRQKLSSTPAQLGLLELQNINNSGGPALCSLKMSSLANVKYSKLTDLEADDGSAVLEIKPRDKNDETFNFDSIYDYDEEAKKKYNTGKNTFNSVFKYTNMTPGRPRGHLAVDVSEEKEMAKPSTTVVVTSYILTVLSYIFFVLTLPLTYWMIVKKLGEFDRLVVFRLGKMIGVKGPGRVLIFPWMDRTKK